MLPLLRILPVGGVLLAIMIVLLALNPPGGTDSAIPSAATPARGALVRASEHPEWRQFLIQAAVRRAGELERLRDLPDTPVWMPEVKVEVPVAVQDLPPIVTEPPAKVVGLPTGRSDTDSEDVTGSIPTSSGATMPIEIGETSSTELPVTPPPDTPPVIRTPERTKPQNESRRKPAKRVARPQAPAAAPVEQPTQNIFEQLFGQKAPSAQPARPAARPNTARPPAANTAQR